VACGREPLDALAEAELHATRARALDEQVDDPAGAARDTWIPMCLAEARQEQAERVPREAAGRRIGVQRVAEQQPARERVARPA